MNGRTAQGHEEGFDLSTARLPDFYPDDDVLVEIGRVAIAATRVDRQLALVLSAVKFPEPEEPMALDVLLRWSTSQLIRQARKELKRRFEGDLLKAALAVVDSAAERQERRHAVLHSLWTPEPRSTSFKVEVLAGLRSQAELDELVRERGKAVRYETRHPRGGGPGPQEMAELNQIRADLEDSKYTLDSLRYMLASALFAGSPAGAKRCLSCRLPTANLGGMAETSVPERPGRSGS